MTKSPMIRTGLPALREQAKAPVKKDFEQAVALLRKASGKPEYRLVPLRCAVHDRPFVVIYCRDDPSAPFRINKISKEAPARAAGSGLIGRLLTSGSEGLAAYDQSEFNSAGRQCPWCGDKSMVVHCEDCGDTYCGGTIVKCANGGSMYDCVPRCGSHGILTDYDKVHGKRGVPKLPKKQPPLLGNSKKVPALPAPKRLLLPGK